MNANEREIIELKIKLNNIEVKKLDEAYHKMHQIDMQSSEGEMNRRQKWVLYGSTKALEWVLSKFTD